MGICDKCGEEISFRYVEGRNIPFHFSGGCTGESTTISKSSSASLVFEKVCYPTKCPKCASSIYFIKHNGGSVWLDELGWPWPKHKCFTQEKEPKWLNYFKLTADKLQYKKQSFGLVISSERIQPMNSSVSYIYLVVDFGNGMKKIIIVDGQTTDNYLLDKFCIFDNEKNSVIFSSFDIKNTFNNHLKYQLITPFLMKSYKYLIQIIVNNMKCCEAGKYRSSIYAVFKKDDSINKVMAESVCGNCINSYLDAYKSESIQHEVYVIRDI